MVLKVIYCELLHRGRTLCFQSQCVELERAWGKQFDNVFKIIIYGHIELRNLNSH